MQDVKGIRHLTTATTFTTLDASSASVSFKPDRQKMLFHERQYFYNSLTQLEHMANILIRIHMGTFLQD